METLTLYSTLLILCRGAQKIGPVLLVLHQVLNTRIRVFLNPVDKHSEMPNKSFYKVVLEPTLSFTEEGSLTAGPRALFHNVPEQPILTPNMHTPDNWLVEPAVSIYDLDNIKESAKNIISKNLISSITIAENHSSKLTPAGPEL